MITFVLKSTFLAITNIFLSTWLVVSNKPLHRQRYSKENKTRNMRSNLVSVWIDFLNI